jgi:hypothetical protein
MRTWKTHRAAFSQRAHARTYAHTDLLRPVHFGVDLQIELLGIGGKFVLLDSIRRTVVVHCSLNDVDAADESRFDYSNDNCRIEKCRSVVVDVENLNADFDDLRQQRQHITVTTDAKLKHGLRK